MSKDLENFETLLSEGKFKEALALVEQQKAKSKHAPDTVRTVGGKARFTHRGKTVEVGEDGMWRLTDSATEHKK